MTASSKISKTVAARLLRAEMALLDPAVRRDRTRVAAFLADDFCEFGASGRVWNREQILDLLASEDYTPPIIEDFSCHRIAANTVLVTYRTVRLNSHTTQREVTLRSSLWIKHGQSWRLRFHQGTRAG